MILDGPIPAAAAVAGSGEGAGRGAVGGEMSRGTAEPARSAGWIGISWAGAVTSIGGGNGVDELGVNELGGGATTLSGIWSGTEHPCPIDRQCCRHIRREQD